MHFDMILVFKTNVRNKKMVRELKPVLDKITGISRWNFDITDCDRILRIECQNNISADIIQVLEIKDFECEELE